MNKEFKITGKEFQEYSWQYDVLSDMDYSLNSETGEYTVPAVEWDGPYGTHWVRFVSEEARELALTEYQTHMNGWVIELRKRKFEELEAKRLASKKLQEMKTLGGQFPQLMKLKNSL